MEKLKAQIEELLYDNGPSFQIAKVIKSDIKTYFSTLEDTFATSGGKDFLVKHTKMIDSILQIIYKVALREMFGDYAPMKNSIPISMAALGSYGREQLCVYSDIDLMIVYKDIPGYNAKEMIEKILYILWDTGLKLGHRVHTVEELYEISKTDITIKTAMIESRFIEGSHFTWVETQNAIDRIRHDNVEEYIDLKLEEQAHKHARYPLTMQPNLKEGVGGFRDANLVYWIGKILYNTDNIKSMPWDIVDDSEYKKFRIALEFLFRVRSALHLAAGKKEDTLRLSLIPKVSELLGYPQTKAGHMKFAKKVTSCLKTIRLYSTIWIDVLTEPYQKLQKNNATLKPGSQKKNFHSLLKTLCTHAKEPFKVHSSFLKALIDASKPERPTSALYKTIATIFYQPYSYYILDVLSDARLLGYTIPPIKQIVDLPQFDGYHDYAVDIHSLLCVYHLEHIEDAFIQTLFDQLSKDEKAMLKLVTFLHDAGKGRKRDHHQVGVSLFRIFAEKVNMKETLIKDAEQLILYHTLMSSVAQREDIYNESVVLGFASHFPNQKLLDMIYILTYADMSGVGKNIYNSFNAKLIKTLYHQSVEVLDKKTMLDEASKRVKTELALKRNADFKALGRVQQKKILQIPSNLLFLRYSAKHILAIAQKAFQTKHYVFEISNQKFLTIEVIRRDNFNVSYLLSKLSQIDVVKMDISKLFDDLKYFKIDFSEKVNKEDIAHIELAIEDAFDPSKLSKTNIPVIDPNELEIDCEHSKTYASMHLNCMDQKGLLAYTIRQLDQLGVDIATAKIHTIKKKARGMFLIERNGNFCDNTDIIINKLTEEK